MESCPLLPALAQKSGCTQHPGCVLPLALPLALAFSPPHSLALRQALGLGPIFLALSAGVTLSWRTVGCQSSSLPCLFQDIGDQEMSGQSQSVSHKVVSLGQNPLLEASVWHKLQAIYSKTRTQNTEILPPPTGSVLKMQRVCWADLRTQYVVYG